MIHFNESLFCLYFCFNRPKYRWVEKTGLDHDPEFKVKLILRQGANKPGFEEVFESINKPYIKTYGFGKNEKPEEIE